MTCRILSWIREKVHCDKKSQEVPTLELTPLHETRTHNLTPSPSQESLVSNSQSSSPFFTALSAELRIAILTAAFGDRTMHIHFHDTTPPPVERPRPSRWKNDKTPKYYPRAPTRPRLTGRFCYCSRDNLQSHCYDLFAPCHGTSEYNCLSLFASMTPWPALYSARVGAMGFLLSCRRAYTEGIEIFYGTNTFHIVYPYRYLSTGLDCFLPQPRLHRGRRLELVLERVDPFPYREPDEPFHVIFPRMLSTFSPALFPRLTTLDIAFQDYPEHAYRQHEIPWNGAGYVAWMQTTILPPLDGVVKNLPGLKSCRVYFYRQTFAMLIRHIGFDAKIEAASNGKFWRRVKGVDEDGDRGYWICVGREEVREDWADSGAVFDSNCIPFDEYRELE